MKLRSPSLYFRFLLFAVTMTGLVLARTVQAQPTTNTANAFVTNAPSVVMHNTMVYSLRFPGGTASSFFNFLGTNGLSKDTVLLAGRSGECYIPPFTVNNVRLKEVAKCIELLTEGALQVELVEMGEASDVNIWRVKSGIEMASVKTRACAMPNLLASKNADEHIGRIIDTVRTGLDHEGDMPGRGGNLAQGHTYTLGPEKIVVVMGTETYVEA